MKTTRKAAGLLERKLREPACRERFERGYELFQLEAQIQLALEKRGWTYAELAAAVGTSKSNISRDLNGGGINNATVSRLARIAEALDMRFVPVLVPKERADRLLPQFHDLLS